MSRLRLVADIGGTRARAAIVDAGNPTLGLVMEGSSESALEVRNLFLKCMADKDLSFPIEAVVALAGPVSADPVHMPNVGWNFGIEAMRRDCGLSELTVVNDFVAVAMALPYLRPHEYIELTPGNLKQDGPICVLGPGTGLGVAGLVPTVGGSVAVPGEGGHITMAPANDKESRILDFLRRDDLRGDGESWNGHVSAERVISGPGLSNLYRAIHYLDEGELPSFRKPEDITSAATKRLDHSCIAAVDTFCSMLATIAANVALTLGSSGGVYLAGGILPEIEDYLRNSDFTLRFASKGRMSGYLKSIPVFLIRTMYPALIGLAAMEEPKIIQVTTTPVTVHAYIAAGAAVQAQ